jgi:hypothetical protein
VSQPVFNTPRPSRLYMLWLTVATLLFLLTLTIGIILIIIGNARIDRREDEYHTTLTAVFSDLRQTETALITTSTPAPPVTPGYYVFALAPDSPTYSAAPTCDLQVLSGLVLDDGSQPVDRYTVVVWGDYTSRQTVLTGQVAGQDRGRWMLPLPGMLHRRVWVQLTAGDRYFSAPTEIVFDQNACDRNRVEIILEQVAPLE